jgi:hypothetical protein
MRFKKELIFYILLFYKHFKKSKNLILLEGKKIIF